MNKKDYFPEPLTGVFVGEGKWRLDSEFEYHSPKYGQIIVPVGFVSDGASIPKFVYSIIGSPWGGRWAESSVIHDFLYFSHSHPRKIADDIFLEGMKVCGVHWWRRKVMWGAVRLAGFLFWKK